MKQNVVLVYILLLAINLAFSQPFTQTYDHEIGSGARDIIELQNSDILVGVTKSFAVGNSKYNINRFAENGSHLWNFRQGFPFNNSFAALLENSNGQIYLGGNSSLDEINVSNSKSYIVKIKPNSDTIWTSYYELQNENRRNGILDMEFLTDSSIICVGAARKMNVDGSLGLVFNIDADGTILWDVIDKDLDNLDFRKVLIDEQGFIYCIGEASAPNKGREIAIAKYQFDGTRLWIQNYGGYSQDVLLGVNLLDNGTLIVGIGSSEIVSPFDFSCGFFQVTPEGDSTTFVPIPETEEFADCFDFVGMETMSDNSIRVIRTSRKDGFLDDELYELLIFDDVGNLQSQKWLGLTLNPHVSISSPQK